MTGTEKKIVYMDHAATTYAAPEVVEAMLPYFSEKFGNPSSVYGIGQENKAAVDDEIYFTAGGTESDNWALKGVAFANIRKGKHIITTAVEHHAVLHAAEWLQSQGFEVTYLPVDQYGMVSPADVEKAIRPDTILISVMYANNEVGTIQPIAEIGAIARAHGIYFHTDAVQAVGHVPIDVKAEHIDMLSLSVLRPERHRRSLHPPRGTDSESAARRCAGEQTPGRNRECCGNRRPRCCNRTFRCGNA